MPNVADAIAAVLELETPSDEEAWKACPEDHEVFMTNPSSNILNIELETHNEINQNFNLKIFL